MNQAKHKSKKLTKLFILTAGAVLACALIQVRSAFAETTNPADFNEIVVGSDSNKKQYLFGVDTIPVGGDQTGQADSQDLVEIAKNTILTRAEADDAETISYDEVAVVQAELTEEEAEKVKSDPLVTSFQENKLRFTTLNDSTAIIGASALASNGITGEGTAVAILDTGVDNDHTFINVVDEACFSNSNGFGGGTSLCPNGQPSQTGSGSGNHCDDAVSGCDHGTHVAGIAAGTGVGAAFSGVAPDADVIGIQVFTSYSTFCPNTTPCLGSSDSDIIAGLNHVLDLHNDPGFTQTIASVNLSLGGGLYSDQAACDFFNSSTKSAIDSLRAAGIATVVATGNDGSSSAISAPGCISTAIAVGSTTKGDQVSSFTNSNQMLDLLATGSAIQSSINNGSFGFKSGTSMATPHVAGVIALLKSGNANVSVDDILSALTQTGIPITDPANSLEFKRVNVDAAYDELYGGVVVNAVDVESGEDGDAASVQFSLGTQPSSDVTIALSVSDASEADLSGVTEIVIAAADWDTPASNTVTITGVDDAITDGDISYSLITGDVTSSDTYFDGLEGADVADVSLINLDDEAAPVWGQAGDTPTPADFDGDTIADLAVWRPGDGTWNITNSAYSSTTIQQWGNDTVPDVPVSNDYDGDDKTDIAVWRPSNGRWYIRNSSDDTITNQQWGNDTAPDIPVPADYDGDGLTDIAVWRGNGNGNWYIRNSSDSSITVQQWGSVGSGDTPVPADYDGDGKADIAVWRGGGSGNWFIRNSSDGSITVQQWGSEDNTDTTAQADYDGDGKADIAVWRADNNTWYIRSSQDDSIDTIIHGDSSLDDVVKPYDANNDGLADPTLWRPSTAEWLYYIDD